MVLADLACLNIDIECDDVNVVVAQYDTSLSRLLDKHAPFQKKITESNGDQKKLFNIVNTLLGRRKQLVLPDYNNPITLASTFNMFLLIRLQTFVQSFHCLRAHYPLTRLSRWILLCLIVQFCLRVLL